MLSDVEAMRAFLQAYKKKNIDLDTLQAAFSAWDYARFRKAVTAFLDDGSLQAVRSAGIDFSGLPRRLRRVTARLFSSAPVIQTDAIRLSLSPQLDFSSYYEAPLSQWQEDLPFIERLSAWLEGGEMRPAPLQQRSWDIFRDEKYLLGPGTRLLHRLHLSLTDLFVCDEADPLMLAVQAGCGGSVCHHLIVENKAPYYRLLPHLKGSPLTSLVFGCGWKIAANLGALPQQCGYPGARHIAWYFGDFDWEGLRIWQGAAAVQGVEVRLAVPFYRAFLTYEAPQGKEQQQENPEAFAAFAAAVGPDMADAFRHILENHAYYPQEALGEADLVRALKELSHGIRTFF